MFRLKMTSKQPACDYCKIELSCKSSKSRHQKSCPERPDIISSPTNITCDKCEKLFSRKDALKAHAKICKGPKGSLVCTDCLKTFKRKQHLDAHLKMHARKGYTCSTCGREFKRTDFFKKHACVVPDSSNKRSVSDDSNELNTKPKRMKMQPARELKDKLNLDDPFGFKAFQCSGRSSYSMLVSSSFGSG